MLFVSKLYLNFSIRIAITIACYGLCDFLCACSGVDINGFVIVYLSALRGVIEVLGVLGLCGYGAIYKPIGV